MKKKILPLLLIFALCLALCVGVYAAGAARLTDAAGLLTEEERTALAEKLDDLSEELDFDLVILTVDSLNGREPDNAAWSFYQENGFRSSGAILLISMEDSDWIITACGDGQKALNGDARDYLAELFVSDLSAGNYARAFHTFADTSRTLVRNEAEGKSFKTPFNVVKSLLISLAVGVVLALIIVGIMKRKLKSVAPQCAASEYITAGSLNIKEAHERFLYFHIARTPRVQNERSSFSGSSHSSTGGKF